ncbi:hypothetical protein [Kaarinaea lacus]
MAYIAGFIILLVLAYIGNAVNQLLAIRLQRPKIQLKNSADIPVYIKKLYADATNQLLPLGFKPHHWQMSQDFLVQAAIPKWSLVLAHPVTKVFAEISPASTAMDMPGYEVNFWSIAPDGNCLLTMNGRSYTVLSEIPGVTIHDPQAQSLHQQYDYHLEERREWSSSTNYQIPNAATYIQLQQKAFDGYIENLTRERGIVAKRDNQFRLSLLKCLKIVKRYVAGEKHAKKLADTRFKLKLKNKLTGTGNKALPSSQYPVESDVLSYRRLSAVRERQLTGLPAKITLLVAALFIAYVILEIPFSNHSVLILIAGIMLHELGHFLGMLIFRYRDSDSLCVQLMGTASVARNEGIATWKQVIIVLMGPLPGIIAGLLLLVLFKHDSIPWLYETAVIFILMNYLHLLPFSSLDGGRLLRLAVMTRWPMGKLLIVLSIGSVFAAAAYYGGQAIFWLLSMLAFASIPFTIRESSVLRELNKQMKEQSKTSPKARSFYTLDLNHKLARIFMALKNPKYRKYDFSLKFNLVKSLNGVIASGPSNSTVASTGFLLLYLGTLSLVPQSALFFGKQSELYSRNDSIFAGQPAKNDLETKIANATTPGEQFNLLLKACSLALKENDTKKAVKFLEQAEAVYGNINSDEALARLFTSYTVYHQHTKELSDAATYQKKAIELYEKDSTTQHYNLATGYQNLSAIQFKQGKNSLSEINLQKALSFAIQINQPEKWNLITQITGQLLDWYYLEGRQHEATQLMGTLKEKFANRDEAIKNYISLFIYEELGWLNAAANDEKAAMEKFDKALSLAEHMTSQTDTKHLAHQLETRLVVSKAAIYYKEGYLDFSKMQFANAETLARENSYPTLEEYIEKNSPKLSTAEKKNNQHREIRRWKLITDAYRKAHG